MTEKNKDSSVLHRPKRLKTEYAEEEQIERNLIESRRKGKSAVHYGKRCKVNVTCQECGFRMTSVDQVTNHPIQWNLFYPSKLRQKNMLQIIV